MATIESTYKAKDVEEIIDIYLYRPWGYALAVGAHKLKMTPNQISILGMLVGIISGHLFVYTNPWLNAAGVFMWMLGQALDGADGQLARMANMRSRLGRMLDGISDSVKFASLYLHIGYRLYESTGNPWFFALVIFAGLTHSYQSSLADFYRNAYLFFVEKPGSSEIEDSVLLETERKAMPWKGNFWEKLLLRPYITYARRLEGFSDRSGNLYRRALERFGTNIPDKIRDLYRTRNRHLLKYYNALTTNTRMVVFFGSLILGNFWIFFLFEIFGLNGLMILLMLVIQPRADRAVLEAMEERLEYRNSESGSD